MIAEVLVLFIAAPEKSRIVKDNIKKAIRQAKAVTEFDIKIK